MHEGQKNAFDENLLKYFSTVDIPLIAFGGISELEQMHNILSTPNISAVAIGNSLNYREHSVQFIKENMESMLIRKPNYKSHTTLLGDV